METETLPQVRESKAGLPVLSFKDSEVQLIKDLYCKGATDDEFALFLYVCKHRRLNPLLRQIHAVKRWDSALQKEALAIQTGIDGYRLIAERTKRYAPGPEPTYAYDSKGKLLSATASIKLRTEDGEWVSVSATAFYAEYVQLKKDGTPNSMWQRMPHSQTAKCAEALAIRRAFPEDTSEIRTDEEMGQADNPDENKREKIADPKPKSEKSAPKEESQTEGQAEEAFEFEFIPTAGGTKGKSFWVKDDVGNFFSTFDAKHGAVLAKATKEKVAIHGKAVKKGEYTNIIEVALR